MGQASRCSRVLSLCSSRMLSLQQVAAATITGRAWETHVMQGVTGTEEGIAEATIQAWM